MTPKLQLFNVRFWWENYVESIAEAIFPFTARLMCPSKQLNSALCKIIGRCFLNRITYCHALLFYVSNTVILIYVSNTKTLCYAHICVSTAEIWCRLSFDSVAHSGSLHMIFSAGFIAFSVSRGRLIIALTLDMMKHDKRDICDDQG